MAGNTFSVEVEQRIVLSNISWKSCKNSDYWIFILYEQANNN